MHDRWPKGTRPPRTGSRAWLRDSRGRPYRLSGIVAFHVYFQATEGKLWNRIYRDGVPLRLPALMSQAEFVAEVGNREGAYQLQPLDGHEHPCGDPPSMVFLPLPVGKAGPETPAGRSPAPAATVAVAPGAAATSAANRR